MHTLIVAVVVGIVAAGLAYAFRGKIRKEIDAVGADVKTDVAADATKVAKKL